MKRNYFKVIIVIALLCTLFLSACEFSTGKEETSEAPQVIIITATPNAQAPVVTEPPAVIVTEPPAPATEPPAVIPTDPPVLPTEPPVETTQPPAESSMYFKDEFDNGLDNYSHFIFKADEFRIYENNESLEKKAGVELQDGEIRFNIQDYWLYYYFIYEPQVYEDVKVSVEVKNQGFNSSMASLICRYDEDLGWYEVKIDASGQWAMYYYDSAINKNFNWLTNGGAAVFNYGKDTNVYTLVCEGKNLSFYVNDVLSQTVENKDLKSGKVGFSIQSPKTYTLMKVPWFEISEP